MKVSIIPYDNWHGRKEGTIGSSIIRAKWLIPHWPEASIWTQGAKADVYIFQKIYWTHFMKDLEGKAKRILDLCDPDWMKNEFQLRQTIEYADAITCSSEELARIVRRYTTKPVLCIPDRIDPALFPKHQPHIGQAEKIAWFGYHHNADDIFKEDYILQSIIARKLKLKIIAEKPWQPYTDYGMHVENAKYDWESLPYELQECDLVINPRPAYKHYRFKSNNKTLIAWANGLPVAETLDDLDRFMKPEERSKEIAIRKQEIAEHWDVKYSIKEYKDLISTL